MKRVAGVLVLLLLMLLAGVVGVWMLNLRAADRSDHLPIASPPAAGSATRGAYLARAGNCMTCHTERGGAAYAGGRSIETPFGSVYTSNLTPDPQTGIGSWSAAHFWRAMHHGRSRDGRLLYPAFPYTSYTQVTRTDSDAIFDYLRTLAPVQRANTAHRLRWPYSTQAALAAWRALYFTPGGYQPEPRQTAEWNRGAYLVQGLGHCAACHSARNALGASRDLTDLSGGLIPMQNWYAPSLASPAEAGVADWDTGQVIALLQTGATPRATVLGPMAEVVLHSTQYLSAADLAAMAVYLKALPQAKPDTAPPAPVAVGARVAERGAKLYGEHCVQCHGGQGLGVPGAYPPLAGNRAVNLPVTANLVQVVLHGGYPPATTGNPRPFGMPPYALLLSEADVAAVLTHIRGSWGNRGQPVTELAVTQQRGVTPP